jgi:feruloyl-CoA synthase
MVTELALAARQVVARQVGSTWYLESPQALREPPRRLGDLLRRAAERAPERTFLIERDEAALRRVTYAEAQRAAEGIASWLLREGRGDRPVLALSGNSIDHALLMLGCFLAGVPIAPVSPAYSLLSQDLAKLRRIVDRVRPRVVFVEARGPFERALAVLAASGATVVDSARLRELAAGGEHPDLPRREAEVGPDDVAKILFTSGSTGFPKGVPNTHRMLAANQQMIAQLWPFLEQEPPVLVDWLPWSHTFGANHNFNMVLFHAGTLFVDQGKPTDALIGKTLENLRACPPTIYFNVPAGFAALVPRLEADDGLRRAFFDRLRVVFYAAAALPDDLWQRLKQLARRSTDREVFLTTAWGSTETSPLSTSAHFPLERAGNIGLPAPGVTLKLVPSGRKLEVRVHGPHVMREYLEEPELTRDAFDDEGFYRIGDAVRFADPADPSGGLLFDGRVAEDFKLDTGTWVSVSTIRTGVLAEAAPALADLVVAGHDRPGLGVLAWPSVAGCRQLVGEGLDLPGLCASERLREHVRTALARWNAAHPESSTRVARALLLVEPATIDAGEITDKGYVNQRATLERRASLVERLFATTAGSDVIVL